MLRSPHRCLYVNIFRDNCLIARVPFPRILCRVQHHRTVYPTPPAMIFARCFGAARKKNDGLRASDVDICVCNIQDNRVRSIGASKKRLHGSMRCTFTEVERHGMSVPFVLCLHRPLAWVRLLDRRSELRLSFPCTTSIRFQ